MEGNGSVYALTDTWGLPLNRLRVLWREIFLNIDSDWKKKKASQDCVEDKAIWPICESILPPRQRSPTKWSLKMGCWIMPFCDLRVISAILGSLWIYIHAVSRKVQYHRKELYLLKGKQDNGLSGNITNVWFSLLIFRLSGRCASLWALFSCF